MTVITTGSLEPRPTFHIDVDVEGPSEDVTDREIDALLDGLRLDSEFEAFTCDETRGLVLVTYRVSGPCSEVDDLITRIKRGVIT